MPQTDHLLAKPAKYIDIATGSPISMSRCLYECQELDKVVKKCMKAETSTSRSSGKPLVLMLQRKLLQSRLLRSIVVVAGMPYGTGYARIRLPSPCK